MATGIPHVADLAAARDAEAHRALLEAQQKNRPPVPTPESLNELWTYLKSDGPIKLRAWLLACYEPQPLSGAAKAMGLKPRRNYPPGYGKATAWLLSAKQQSGYPSYNCAEPIDVEHAVRAFKRDGELFWCWLYRRAYSEYVREQVAEGLAKRKDLTAAIDAQKPFEKPALREAQRVLKPFGG